MRCRSALIVFQLIVAIGICHLRGDEPKNEPAIKFTYFDTGNKNVVVVLGPTASRRFRETVSGKVADFDSKFLEKSEPWGEFAVGKTVYHSHVGIVVLTVNKKPKIWSSKFTEELTKCLLEEDGSYKVFLSK